MVYHPQDTRDFKWGRAPTDSLGQHLPLGLKSAHIAEQEGALEARPRLHPLQQAEGTEIPGVNGTLLQEKV